MQAEEEIAWDETDEAFLRKHYESSKECITAIASYLGVPVFEVYLKAKQMEIEVQGFTELFEVKRGRF